MREVEVKGGFLISIIIEENEIVIAGDGGSADLPG